MRGVSSGKLIRTDEDPVEMNTKETEITPRSLSPGPMRDGGAEGRRLRRAGSSFCFFDRTSGWRPGSAFRCFEIASTPLFAFALALHARCRLAAAARFLVSAS